MIEKMKHLKKYYAHPAVKKSLDDFIKEQLDEVDDLKTIDAVSVLEQYNQYAIIEIRNYKIEQLGL